MKRLLVKSLVAVFAIAAPISASNVALKEIQPLEISKIRMLSNNNMPKKVIVVRNSSTASFVDNLIKTIESINKSLAKPISLHVIVESSYAYSSFKSQMEKAGLYGKTVEINDKFFTYDQWMQDWGEILMADVNGKEELTIFDSNRGRGLQGLPKLFAEMWNAHYLKNPNKAGIKGDYGGNIEVTPDNILVLGNTSTKELRTFFDNKGYANKTALLETDWLNVGHVDEYLSFVPDKSSPGGYAIVKADPALAMDLIKNASEAELNQIYAPYRSQIKNMHEALTNEGLSRSLISDYELAGDNILLEPIMRNEANPERMNQLVDLNRSISALIDRNVEILKQKITEATGGKRTDFKVISFPTIFQGNKYGAKLSRCVALLPGTVNMLVLGQSAVIPDAQFPIFNQNIKKATEDTHIKAYFVENLAYHKLQGQIHCGTNVMREADDYAVKPEIIMRKHISEVDNFKRLFEELY